MPFLLLSWFSMAANEQPDSTSTTLLNLVRQNDLDAWRRLTSIYGPLVYSWVRREGLNEEDAADVGQKVLLTVFERIKGFEHGRDKGTFRGWLRTITYYKLGNHFRAYDKREHAVGGTDVWQQFEQMAQGPREDDRDPVVAAEQSRLMQRVLEIIQTEFEERTWQAFWMSVVDGLPTATIAEKLGMTTRAVRQAKFRVLKRLRDELS